MIENSLLVAIGGFLGAMARYGTSVWIGARYPTVFPRATLIVNLLGSFLLGVTAGSEWGNAALLFVGTGFLGSFTTFSTLSWDSIQLWSKKEWSVLIRYLGITYLFGILLALAGYQLAVRFDFYNVSGIAK